MPQPEWSLNTRPLRCAVVIGLCVLIVGALNPNALASQVNALSVPPNPPAPSTSYPIADADFSLAVSPTRLAMGQDDLQEPQKVLVINKGRLPAAVTVQKRNFTVGLTGSLDFQEDAPFAASEWLTVTPPSFVIPSGGSQTVVATVQTPVSPDPGDYQVALVFAVLAEPGPNNIKVNKGIGVPLFVTVPGPIDDTVMLGNLAAPAFAIDGPVTITATLTNTGTVHRDFRGDAPLRVDAAGSAASFADFTVTRGSTRDVSTTWDPPLLCICQPSVSFTNADGSVQRQTIQVIVFPLKLLGMILGAILLAAFVVGFSRRRYRAQVTRAAVASHRPARSGDA